MELIDLQCIALILASYLLWRRPRVRWRLFEWLFPDIAERHLSLVEEVLDSFSGGHAAMAKPLLAMGVEEMLCHVSRTYKSNSESNFLFWFARKTSPNVPLSWFELKDVDAIRQLCVGVVETADHFSAREEANFDA